MSKTKHRRPYANSNERLDRSPLTWLRRISSAGPVHAILIIGILGSFGAYEGTSNREESAKNEYFHRLAQRHSQEIRDKLMSTTTMLRALRGLFYASSSVGRRDFGAFVRSIEIEGHVQALEWIPRVAASDRLAFERSAVSDGMIDYQFTERSSQGELIRAGLRDYYYPVYYVEPLQGNQRALGFDLGSNEARLAALKRAQDGGKAVASARITLVQEDEDQFSFLIFMPVFAGAIVPETPAERTANLAGFGLGVFRIGDIVTSVLAQQNADHGHAHEDSEIDLFIFDETAAPEGRLLYPRGGAFATREDIQSIFRAEFEMVFADRLWTIVAVPSPSSIFVKTSWTPPLVFILGLLATGILALYVNVVRGRTKYANTLVDERTQELVNVSEHRESILRELKETNKDLESFTHVASHDLKAPLRGIDNLAMWVTEDDASTLSEESKSNINKLRTRVLRLENLLESLLEYSRFGRMKAATKQVDTSKLCNEVVDYLAMPDGFIVVADDTLPVLETVEPAIQTTFSNLISNAIKHHDREQGCIQVSALDLGEEYKFSVADDGPGIDAAHHERIFGFFQTLAQKGKGKSSGMGLSIVTRIVASAGGVINVESEVSKRGTVFHFTWKKTWPKARK